MHSIIGDWIMQRIVIKDSSIVLHRYLLFLILAALLNGCSHIPLSDGWMESDPLEDMNRSIYSFNESLDESIMKPVAETYKEYTPQPMQTGVSNFFSNIDDISVILNDILQLKLIQGIQDIGRFTINSTIGIYGLIDVATPLGLEKHDEDFGQTLGYWGVGSGPYLVLPLLGPSTFRDTTGDYVDWSYDPLIGHPDNRVKYGSSAVNLIQKRADLLYVSNIVDQVALDRYTFVREAYLQQRRNLIYDGDPPQPDLDMTFEEE